MYFALLVSPLPHVTDAHGHYPDVLARAAQTHRVRQAVARGFAGAISALRRLAR